MNSLPEEFVSPEFFTPTSLGDRDWGFEYQIALSSKKWIMKHIKILEGRRGGLQYHRIKDEGGYILSGTLKVRIYSPIDNSYSEYLLSTGDTFRFPPSCIHQEIAITDVEIIEVSTPHLNDRVRVDHILDPDSPKSGLPSTDLSSISQI